MKKALIHIGTGKTGTSSIQNELYKFELKKCTSLFTYPVIYNKGHQALEVLFKDYGRLTRTLKQKFLDVSQFYDFRKEFNKSFSEDLYKNNVLISSEFLFSFKVDEIENLKKFFDDKGFEDYKILVYLRKPSAYYLSLVQQKLKAAHGIPSPLSFNAGYEKSLSNWSAIFEGCLCVKKFERENLLSGSLLDDFSSEVNKFFGTNVLLKGNPCNESVSAEGMIILQDFRRYFFFDEEDKFNKTSDALLRKINEIEVFKPGTKPVLKESYREAIDSNNSFYDGDYSFLKDQVSDRRMSAELESESSGNVADLLESYDIEHYHFLLHRIIFKLLYNS